VIHKLAKRTSLNPMKKLKLHCLPRRKCDFNL